MVAAHRSVPPPPPISLPTSLADDCVGECEHHGPDWNVLLLGLSKGMVHRVFSTLAGGFFQVKTHMVHFPTRRNPA